jgi:hypothetical protein
MSTSTETSPIADVRQSVLNAVSPFYGKGKVAKPLFKLFRKLGLDKIEDLCATSLDSFQEVVELSKTISPDHRPSKDDADTYGWIENGRIMSYREILGRLTKTSDSKTLSLLDKAMESAVNDAEGR